MQAACSEGGAGGEFTAAAGGAGEEEVGYVGAGDEEDEADGGEEDHERGADVADGGFLEGGDAEAFVGSEGVGAVEAAILDGGEGELGVGLGDGDAGAEAGGYGEVVGHVLRCEVELEGNPEVGGGIGDEAGSDDADDGVGCAVELDCRSDDVGVGGVAGLPEVVAEDGDVAAVGAVFGLGEGAAGGEGRAEHGEVVGGDVGAFDLLGVVAAGDVDAGAAEVVGCDLLEDAGLLMPDVEFGDVGAGEVALGRVVAQGDEGLRVGVGERLQ